MEFSKDIDVTANSRGRESIHEWLALDVQCRLRPHITTPWYSGSQSAVPGPQWKGGAKTCKGSAILDGEIVILYNQVQLTEVVLSYTRGWASSLLHVDLKPIYCEYWGRSSSNFSVDVIWRAHWMVPWELVSMKCSWRQPGRRVVLCSNHVMMQQWICRYV